MVILLGMSALALSALQASVAAPTNDFRGCLREAASKATSEKVAADAIEGYLRSACTVQMGSLKNALVAFRVKNGMSKTAAASDAQMTIDDYVGTPVDKYKFMAQQNAPQQASAPQQPASAQPPKP